MKALKITLIVLGTLVLIGGAGYLYASSGIKSKSGYAELAAVGIKANDAILSVNVGPGGLSPFRWLFEQALEHSDYTADVPEKVLLRALKEIQGVQLRIYDAANNRDIFDSAISETAAALKQKQWQTLMTVRDDDEHIVVLQYLDQDQITGLSIMASTPDKALFINLIGPFDTQAIASTVHEL